MQLYPFACFCLVFIHWKGKTEYLWCWIVRIRLLEWWWWYARAAVASTTSIPASHISGHSDPHWICFWRSGFCDSSAKLFCLQVTQNVTFCRPTCGSFLRHVNSVMKKERGTKNSTEPLNNSIAKLTADFALSQSLPTAQFSKIKT